MFVHCLVMFVHCLVMFLHCLVMSVDCIVMFVDCLVMFVHCLVMFVDYVVMFVMYFILITAPQLYGLHYWDQPQSTSQHTLFSLAHRHGNILREGWKEEHAGLFDCIVQSKAST